MLFTQVSMNAKTGPIPVSGSQSNTCPSACPFKKKGCYAKTGPISWHWSRLDKGSIGMTWAEFIGKVKGLYRGSLWRHNQFGDLKGIGNTIDANALRELVDANRGRKGYTYSHKVVLDRQGPVSAANRVAIKHANDNGFTINLSGNSPAHADELKALNIGPVVTVVSEHAKNTSFTPAGNKIIVCPAQYRDKLTCAHCRLCAVSTRSVIIGFRPHGTAKKTVEAITVAA